jgi:membrane-associated protease RseP (regulator of RpoE activity)
LKLNKEQSKNMKRKWIVGILVALMSLGITAGAIYAQDTTETETRAWLGVAIDDVDDQVVVVRVQPGSPANTADVEVGDVIVSLGGTAVTSAQELTELVRAAAPGDAVVLEVERNGEPLSLDVTLGTAPERGNRPGRGDGNGPMGMPFFQMEAVDPLTMAQGLLNADLQAVDGGYEVTNVLQSNNPFSLAIGDVVTALNEQPITELNPMTLMQGMMGRGEPGLNLTVTRDGETVTLEGTNLMGGFGMGMDMMMIPFGMGMPDFDGGWFDFGGPGRGHGGRGNGDSWFFFGPESIPGAPEVPAEPSAQGASA